MAEGTFVTGLELLNHPPNVIQQIDSKPKLDEKNQIASGFKNVPPLKQTRSATAGAKSVQSTKNELLPQIQNVECHKNREVQTKQSGLRKSLTEASFKKPLFQKLANMKDIYEKNRTTEGEKVRSSDSRPPIIWKTKRDGFVKKEYTHADALNKKIVDKFDELYQSGKGGFTSSKSLENFSKRKHFYSEIEKQEIKVQLEQKKFNNLTYEIAKNEKILEGLLTQDKELEKKVDDTTNLEEEKKIKESQVKEWQAKIELEEHKNRQLQHMKQNKKELVLSVKKNYQKLKELFDTYEDGITFYDRDAEYAKTLYGKAKLNAKDLKSKKGMKDNVIDPEFENLLENEISEFEERRNLREILKHEKVIEEELRLQEQEEERRNALARENKFREEENKRIQKEAEHEKELNKIKRQYHEFQKVTHVSRKEQLIEYFDGLQERGRALEKEIKEVEQEIKKKQSSLEDLRKELKFKKFEETEKSKDNFPIDIRLEDLEIMLREKSNEAAERENNIKRLKKLAYEVFTVISRIYKQVQKTKNDSVDKSNVGKVLSFCGLSLERMLTVVIKKRKTFFIESINTDGTIKEGPPTYMNLVSDDVFNKSRKRFEKDFPLDIEQEFEDEQLSVIRDKIKTKDEQEGL